MDRSHPLDPGGGVLTVLTGPAACLTGSLCSLSSHSRDTTPGHRKEKP